MSLIESALEKMRRSGPTAERRGAQSGPRSVPAAPALPPPAPAQLAAPTRRITLDLERLHAAGYLPDPARAHVMADQYRRVKRQLIDKVTADPGASQMRLLQVTSALQGDGKTFTAINLALSLARERDTSVLLIDADLRNPTTSRILGIEGERGLLDALCDPAVDVGSLILHTSVPGLDVLPAGTAADHAAELIASARMAQVAAQICSNPRYIVLFDSAPILLSADSPALGGIVGQVVLVARTGKTLQHALLDAIGRLDNGKLSGIVLNDNKADPGRYHYGYGSYGTQDRDGGIPG
jgi:exopolysaccharide/PEP-CTERM locus tyrosine autokinase